MLLVREKGKSRTHGQQVQGVTGEGRGRSDGGVGRNHVMGKGRPKGGYEPATGPAAGGRFFTVGVAAAADRFRRKAGVAMKCGGNGHALLVCWHCLEKVPGCPRCPNQDLRFEYIEHFALCGLCPSLGIRFQRWWVPQMPKTCLVAFVGIAADASKPRMAQWLPMLDDGRIQCVRVHMPLA